MREIKFRFYDPFNGVYCYSETYEDLAHFFLAYLASVEGGNNPILEQFTGLHDKNGKEIYEGDICELHQHTDVYVVEWDEHYHALIFKGKFSWERRNLTKDIKPKVIGNIHSNPELLEK